MDIYLGAKERDKNRVLNNFFLRTCKYVDRVFIPCAIRYAHTRLRISYEA